MRSGWTQHTLGDLFDFSNGVNAGKASYGSGTPFANVMEVISNESLTELAIPGKVKLSPLERRRYTVQAGDVLFNRTSETPEEVGLASTYVGLTPIVFGGFVLRGRPKSHLLDPGFSKYALRTNTVRRQIIARGQGGIRANVGQRDLASVVIHLPPLSEQLTVAHALDDTTALINELERMLKKKRATSHGLSQSLLSGSVRIGNFRSAWQTRVLGDLAEMRAGGTPSTLVSEYWGGSIRWMNSGDIHRRTIHDVTGRITEKGLRESSARLFPRDTVLVALAGQGRTRGTVAISRVELATNQSIAGIMTGPELDANFLFYNLGLRYTELRGESAGDGGRGGLNLTILKKLPVRLPEINEQREIARILLDADAEIVALEHRLKATRALKAGLIQALVDQPIAREGRSA